MPFLYIMIGLVAGLVSGFLGVGGGAVMVPIFALVLGLTQHQAQGTALAVMLPPVFLLAFLRYYHEGHVNVPMACFVAIGLTVGALIGAHYAQVTPASVLKRVFGLLLIVIGIKMAFFR